MCIEDLKKMLDKVAAYLAGQNIKMSLEVGRCKRNAVIDRSLEVVQTEFVTANRSNKATLGVLCFTDTKAPDLKVVDIMVYLRG